MSLFYRILKFSLSWFGFRLQVIANKKQNKELIKVKQQYKNFPSYKPTQLTIGDLKLEVSNVESTFQMFEDVFVDESHRIKFKTATPLIYDLGANIGLVSLYYKQQYPKAIIKAFEPNPVVFACLQKNVRLNKLENLTTYNKAISHKNGFLAFYCDKGGQVSSVLKPVNIKTELIQIPSIDLKEFIEAETQQIDLIKMDIEGAEIDVIKHCGSSLQKVNRLMVEYHSYKKDKQKLSILLKTLEENGFRYVIKDTFADFDLYNSNYNKSHFDVILHIEAIQNKFFN